MKLCLFISSLKGGGAERVAVTLANAWSINPDISCVTVVTGTTATEDGAALSAGIDHVQLPLQASSRTSLEAITANVQRIRRIRRTLTQQRPDCVIAFMDEMAVLVTLAAVGTGIPVIAALRAEPSGPDLNGIWRRLRVPVYRYLSNAVVVQTKAGLLQANALFPGARLHCIGNPLAELPPVMTDRPPIIASAGRLIPSKGFDVLIDAFSRSRGRNEGWRLSIHGEGPERAKLLEQIARLGLEDCVELPGFTENVFARLGESAIFAFASRSEGFPNALLEAAAMGCACVSTDCNTGPREMLENGQLGLLVPVDDRQALTVALDQLTEDTNLRSSLGAHYKAFRLRYGVKAVANEWVNLARRIAPAIA